MSSTGRVQIQEKATRATQHEFPENTFSVGSSETRLSLLPYLQLFWANRSVLLRVAFVAFLASTLVALIIPNRYQSLTRLMPPDSQSAGALGMIAAMAGHSNTSGIGALAGDLLGVKSSGALFVGILGSQTVQDHLIDQFKLQKLYGESKLENARVTLAEHTGISEDRKSGIITIAVTDHDPKRAAALAQAYVSELDHLVAQVSTSSARRERMFLEGRLQKVKVDLDTAARNFSDFASKNTAIDIPAQGKAMVQAAATLQGELIAAQAELSGLQQIYTNNNVRVRATEARVAELQKKLNEVGGTGTQADLNKDNSMYPSIRKLPLLGVTYADLFRETKIQETVYELLTEQYELAKVQEAKEIPTVKVLDPGLIPTKKTFPPRTVIVVLGTLVGLVLGMTWFVAKSRWDAIEVNDPRKAFATEVFATIQASVPAFARNGSGPNGRPRWEFWRKAPNSSAENPEPGECKTKD